MEEIVVFEELRKSMQEVEKSRGGRFRRADARSRQTPGRGSLD